MERDRNGNIYEICEHSVPHTHKPKHGSKTGDESP